MALWRYLFHGRVLSIYGARSLNNVTQRQHFFMKNPLHVLSEGNRIIVQEVMKQWQLMFIATGGQCQDLRFASLSGRHQPRKPYKSITFGVYRFYAWVWLLLALLLTNVNGWIPCYKCYLRGTNSTVLIRVFVVPSSVGRKASFGPISMDIITRTSRGHRTTFNGPCFDYWLPPVDNLL